LADQLTPVQAEPNRPTDKISRRRFFESILQKLGFVAGYQPYDDIVIQPF
jgi:hypothetical protein